MSRFVNKQVLGQTSFVGDKPPVFVIHILKAVADKPRHESALSLCILIFHNDVGCERSLPDIRKTGLPVVSPLAVQIAAHGPV